MHHPRAHRRQSVKKSARTDTRGRHRAVTHEIRMSYGFHSSERIKRRRTKISIHVRSRSHSVTVAPFPRNLHVAACARFGLNLEPTGVIYGPVMSFPRNGLFDSEPRSRGGCRELWRVSPLPSAPRVNCFPITGFNISFFVSFPFVYSCIGKSNIGNFYYMGNIFQKIFFVLFF